MQQKDSENRSKHGRTLWRNCGNGNGKKGRSDKAERALIYTFTLHGMESDGVCSDYKLDRHLVEYSMDVVSLSV